MRHLLVRIESRNAGSVVTVSDRALSVRFPMLMSVAQEGTSPQRIVVNLRDFLPDSLRTVRTGWLAQCCIEDAPRFRPTPETARPDSALSASIGICCTRVYCRRFALQLPPLRVTAEGFGADGRGFNTRRIYHGLPLRPSQMIRGLQPSELFSTAFY
jgi:hypothetical protein